MRRISNPPQHQGFRAIYSQKSPKRDTTPIELHLEEYEAIKLMDYEMLSQVEAAKYMQVSRPTITRIYESARQKMARALIEGKSIIISGGQYEIDSSWVICNNCNASFSLSKDVETCPWCGSKDTKQQNWKESK